MLGDDIRDSISTMVMITLKDTSQAIRSDIDANKAKAAALMDSIAMHREDLVKLFSSDISSINELQTISIIQDSLVLSDGGSKVGIDTSNTNELITNLSTTGDSLAITEGYKTMKVVVDSSKTNELELPQSPSSGDMNYRDGSAWVNVSAGSQGSSLRFFNGVLTWVPEVDPTDVLNPCHG
jgi:hypothetical protein